jgi:hypothetical protein
MKLSTALNRENRGVAATVLVILILLPLGASIVGFAFGGGGEVPDVFLEKADPRWESCVKDPDWMRFRHMDFLKEVREDVVRKGIPSGVTLAGCGDCHLNRSEFCDKCHEAASVILDCFGCHFYPETAAERTTAERSNAESSSGEGGGE